MKKIRTKFEWYRLTLTKTQRDHFDRILDRSEAHEGTFRNMAGRSTDVLIMNELIDLEERLKRVENDKTSNTK